MKGFGKNKESPYIQHQDVNNSYGWEIQQKLPVNIFEQIKNTFQFNKNFIKNYNEEREFVEYPEILHNLRKNLPFLPNKE